MEYESTFSCNGKVNSNDFHLGRSSISRREEFESLSDCTYGFPLERKIIELFGGSESAATAILNLKDFIKCMEMELRILNRYEVSQTNFLNQVRLEIDFFAIRKSVCDFMLYIRTYLMSITSEWPTMQHPMIVELNADIDEVLIAVRKFLARLKYIPPSTFHYVVANLGNKCNQPEFHLYHIHLELRWLIVTLGYVRAIPWQDAEAPIQQLDKSVELVIGDLIYISTKIFERTTLSDLGRKNPYSCTCVRDIWLMLQTLLDDHSKKLKRNTFWEYVNISLDGIMNTKEDVGEKLIWHGENKENYPDVKNPELFCTWMIYHLTLLYGYTQDGAYIGQSCPRILPNEDEIEKVLKLFLNRGGKEGDRDEIDEELRIMIPLLETLNDWWPSKITMITLLWDCFHRRLDQPFLIQTSGPWSISLEKKTPFDILKQIKMRIERNFDTSKESSYGLFLRFLGMMLKKSYDANDLRIWTQLKGRIFSKFQKKKLEESSEAKLYNFSSLFLTLAVVADTSGICLALLNLLPSVVDTSSLSNPKRTSLNFKCQLVCLLLHADKKLHLQQIAEKITKILDIISCKKDEMSKAMVECFIDTLTYVISSSEKLENGEYYFIGGWIDRYLLECPKNRVGTILKMLVNISERAEGRMLEVLWSLTGRIRTMVFDADLTSGNYREVAQLAAFFTFEALKNPSMATAHQHSALSLFQHFTSIIKVKDVRVTTRYLSLIFDNPEAVNSFKRDVKDYDLILIQAWLKSCVFKHDSNTGEMLILKSHISNLKEIEKLFPSWKDAQRFRVDEKSIFLYLTALSERRKSLLEPERLPLDVRIRVIFNNFDKWALSPITENNAKSDLAIWIYTCIGTIFLCCSTMFHMKNISGNPLKTYLSRCLLLSEEKKYMKHLGKRIFSMVILGLATAGAKTDVTLHGIIIDLFQTYLPLLVEQNEKIFKIDDSLTKCFLDGPTDFVTFIIDKISRTFICSSNNANSIHERCYLVIELYKYILASDTIFEKSVIESIVTKGLPRIISTYLGVHDHHPHKGQVFHFIIELVKNLYYKTDQTFRLATKKIISITINSHLPYKPHTAFELLRSIGKIDMTIVQYTLPLIEGDIKKLEESRRPNAQSLRYSFNQLQDFMKRRESI